MENTETLNQPQMEIKNAFSLQEVISTKEKKIKDLLLSPFLSDTIMLNQTTGKEYPCHRVILCSGSKYFYFNFFQNEKEIKIKDNKFVVEIPSKIESKLSDSDYDSVIPIMLKFVYHNQKIKKISKEITNSNIFNLLSLAHCFNIPKLNKHLGKIIKETILKEDNCVRVFYESLQYENENLQNECLNVIKKNFEKIIENLDEFQRVLELPFNVFLNLIKADDLVVKSEKTICDLVFNYIKIRRNLNEKVEENKRYDEKNKVEENKESKEQNENNNVIPISNPNENEKPLSHVETFPKSYNEYWNNKIEEIKRKLIKKALTKEEERNLMQDIRFSHLSHSELLSLSIETQMNEHRDLILEGLSIRLNTYENCQEKPVLKINTASRSYINSETKKEVEKETGPINTVNNNLLIDHNDKSINYDEIVNFKNESNLHNFKPKSNNNNNNVLSHSYPRPPQDTRISSLSYTPNFYRSMNNNLQSIVEFNYDYDFDENGIFFYLGTLGKSSLYRNPYEIAQVKVFSSSLGKGRLSDFIGRDLVNLRTLNEPFSFFGVDLGEDRFLIPSCYSIKNRNSSTHVMLCWTLEASNDKINFESIDARIFTSNDGKVNQSLERERSLLKSPGCTSTWGVDPKIKEKFPKGFRYFVLKQLDKNSSGSYNLAISGFEMYGKGIGKWGFSFQ